MNSKFIFFFILIFLVTSSYTYSQNEKDTKEFIVEKYNENFLEIYSPSFIFFDNNILKVDAESLADRKLTDEEFKNIFICASDIEVGIKESQIISLSESIDIRDITKVSTTKQDDNNYLISIYLSGNFHSVRLVHNSSNNETKKKNYLDRMKIQIGSNKEVAIKLKKAIIHLGKLKGVTIKDGDLF